MDVVRTRVLGESDVADLGRRVKKGMKGVLMSGFFRRLESVNDFVVRVPCGGTPQCVIFEEDGETKVALLLLYYGEADGDTIVFDVREHVCDLERAVEYHRKQTRTRVYCERRRGRMPFFGCSERTAIAIGKSSCEYRRRYPVDPFKAIRKESELLGRVSLAHTWKRLDVVMHKLFGIEGTCVNEGTVVFDVFDVLEKAPGLVGKRVVIVSGGRAEMRSEMLGRFEAGVLAYEWLRGLVIGNEGYTIGRVFEMWQTKRRGGSEFEGTRLTRDAVIESAPPCVHRLFEIERWTNEHRFTAGAVVSSLMQRLPDRYSDIVLTVFLEALERTQQGRERVDHFLTHVKRVSTYDKLECSFHMKRRRGWECPYRQGTGCPSSKAERHHLPSSVWYQNLLKHDDVKC